MRVVLFPTCLADLLFPEAAAAAARVLRRLGCEVSVRFGAVCCGQPAWNSGHVAPARRVARGALSALAGDEPVIACSGSCAAMVHDYWPELFAGTRHEAEARDVAARIREFSSFVGDEFADRVEGRHPDEGAVSYHDSCHMLRSLGIKEQPRALLARAGVEVRELSTPERCCGFGGTFAVRYPELSCAMADEKVDDASAKGVDTIVASDLGCLMHICGRARARGVALDGVYIAEVLDRAMASG